MKAAILYKYLIRMHPRDNYTRQVHARTRAFERARLSTRTLGFRAPGAAGGIQKREVGLVPDQCEDEVVLQRQWASRRLQANGIRQNFGYLRVEIAGYF